MTVATPAPSVLLPPPAVFGLPAKFSHWRQLQERAILAAADSSKRFILQAAPTGFGKSLVYIAQALITGARTCILTSTKGLQSQLVEDFSTSGLVDIRGMNSYPCRAADEYGLRSRHSNSAVSCEEGPCRSGVKCNYKLSGCDYYDQYYQAQNADLVVTNYSYWMNINKYGEGLGDFDLLVMDEGHDAFQCLSDFLSIEFEYSDVESAVGSDYRPPETVQIDSWRRWAAYNSSKLDAKLDKMKKQIESDGPSGNMLRESATGRRISGKLKSLSGMKGDWIYESTGRRHKFDPVWPKEYAESCLFRGIDKVVVFSATLRPKTAEVLGIKSTDYEFCEYPSPFPISRRPVYHVPTAQLNFRATEAHYQTMVTRVDQVIRSRMDRKGIIHTTSFDRRNLIVQNSEYADLMMTNDSRNTRYVIERFRDSPPPLVLISPSLTTGYDFPYDACHYQILLKIPFPDNRPLIQQARSKSDKDYGNYMAAQTLVQTCGRGMRAEDDLCETLILDDSVRWFVPRYRQYFPKWWLESFIWANSIPKPLDLGRSVP